MPRRMEPDALAALLPPDGLTLVSSCSAESDILAGAVTQAGEALGQMTFAGIFVPGLNGETWHPSALARTLTFFMTPELRALGAATEFLPLCYADIRALLVRRRPDAALFMCAPPDADGRCSFGTQVDFIADLWRDVPVRIAHVNPLMPRTPGDVGIPFDALTGYVEGAQPLRGTQEAPADPISGAIGAHVASLVPDGAVLQTGVGKVPGAALRALRSHLDLRIHSGLIGDAVVDLAEAGALAPGAAVTAGVAIGSTRLYDAVSQPIFDFRPVSVTHDLAAASAKGPLIAINSAIEVDLFGQAYAELTPHGLMSGPGGASDFAQAARASGGLRIVALPASAARGAVSRIVPAGSGMGPVSLGRMDIDAVVTEHGVADLRGKSHEARAHALIAIADPAHREALATGWRDFAARL